MGKRGWRAVFVVPGVALALIGCAAMMVGQADAQDTVQRFVTQGRAKTVVDDLYKCPVKVSNHRVSAVGQITATDGTVITVPAETAFQKGVTLKGADLYQRMHSGHSRRSRPTCPRPTCLSSRSIPMAK